MKRKEADIMPDLIKLHLGCGPYILEGWKNIDLMPGPGGIALDIRQGLQEENESVDYIFSEHFIEHLKQKEGIYFLADCYRVLKPGGVIRISTPSLKSLVNDYRVRKIDRFMGTWEPKTPCQMMNEAFRLWGHEFLYDIEELTKALYDTGFSEVEKRDWGKSKVEPLNGLEFRPWRNDLIVEAAK
jgi:predicted SAM-dependent methyltransferase